jgi:hypothetical protein
MSLLLHVRFLAFQVGTSHSIRSSFTGLDHSALTFIAEWITRGRGGKTNRALRADIAILSINPSFLPCKRPSAAWVARQHGVSRQRASELWREFASEIAPYIQFRGQRFRNRWEGRKA